MTNPTYLARTSEGFELRVKVVPGASKTEVVGPLGDRLKVRIAAPAESGQANRALIELLSSLIGTREIEIIAGHTSAEKTLVVRGVEENQLKASLSSWAE